jgi:SAM-dependent methyltransferase
MEPSPAGRINADVWQALYAAGKNDLHYPSEVLVRLGGRYLGRDSPKRILDYGFGTGANLLHFARQGHEMSGVEVSQDAVRLVRERLAAQDLQAGVDAIAPGSRLPFADGYFDVVVAWQVLYYNDRAGWAAAVRELERVAAAGALILVATAAPGDISQLQSEHLEGSQYRSRVAGQEGCILTIPEREELAGFFPGRTLEIGEFGYAFGDIKSRHWIITYRTPKP